MQKTKPIINLNTQEGVFEILKAVNYNVDSLISRYTKAELTTMYSTLYNTKPLSSYKKDTIAERIRAFKLQDDRYKALSQL